MHWRDIPQRIKDGGYVIDLPWENLEMSLQRYISRGLQIEPDFQRGHVWSPEQRVAYLESKLQGGVPMDIVRFNQPGWMTTFEGDFVCVDGLQRLTTACMFLRDEIPVFGTRCSEFQGAMPWTLSFKVMINSLKTRAEVLRWYLELNDGGTPHSPTEIARVRAMYQQEVS